jgi:hypothetical protein
VVAPISSAEGAVAAVIAVAAGESLGAGTALAPRRAIVAPASSSSRVPTHTFPRVDHVDPRAALFGWRPPARSERACTRPGRASLDLPIAWAILPPRLFGVAFHLSPAARHAPALG